MMSPCRVSHLTGYVLSANLIGCINRQLRYSRCGCKSDLGYQSRYLWAYVFEGEKRAIAPHRCPFQQQFDAYTGFTLARSLALKFAKRV